MRYEIKEARRKEKFKIECEKLKEDVKLYSNVELIYSTIGSVRQDEQGTDEDSDIHEIFKTELDRRINDGLIS